MRRILLRALLAATALAVTAACGWYLHARSLRKDFEARVEALRAAGQPTRFLDLATPPIPDGENGAKLLEEAHRVLTERMDATRDDDLLYKVERTAEEEAALAAYLDSLAPYFEMLARVPERQGFWLDLDWNAGIEMKVDLYAQLNEARSHLVARVEVDRDEAGRTERAANTAVLLLALGAKCRGPFLIGHLVAESMSSSASELLRSAMRQPGFDAALFRRIVDPPLARSTPERGPPRSVFVQERAFAIGAVEAIAAGAPYGYRGETRTISLFRLPSFYRKAAQCLHVLDMAISRSETTPERAIQVAAELSAESDPDDWVFGDAAKLYSYTFTAFADMVASRRLTRVVMALLEHRQREGAWPEDLSALGDMPGDPYGGKPFLYERTEHGCKVRSAKEGKPEDLEERSLLWALEDDQIPAMAR